MSAALSASSKKRYGVAQVCRAWETPRSTLSHRREISRRDQPPQWPGPKPLIPDQEIAERIRAQHAGMRIGKARVLRIMREHGLLAPARAGRYHGPKVHDGTIHTELPDQMWGTDATRVWTPFGYVWILIAVDHFSLSFVASPEGNGVTECFIRTPKGGSAEGVPKLHSGSGAAAAGGELLQPGGTPGGATAVPGPLQRPLVLERHGYATPSEVRRRLKTPSQRAA